jgi:hypothetical protein
MNHRVTPPGPAKGRRAWLYLSLLLPSLASEVAQCPSPPADRNDTPLSQSSSGPSRAYLRYIGPPQLRFQEALPPPDLSVRPPAGGPPKPQAVNSDGTPADASSPKLPLHAVTAAAMVARKEDARPAPMLAPPPPPPPPAILPDDVAPKARPEDFLPYFQFPGAGSPAGDANTAGQAPQASETSRTIPRSSATYQEQLQ